jgi:hypothetical protein
LFSTASGYFLQRLLFTAFNRCALQPDCKLLELLTDREEWNAAEEFMVPDELRVAHILSKQTWSRRCPLVPRSTLNGADISQFWDFMRRHAVARYILAL